MNATNTHSGDSAVSKKNNVRIIDADSDRLMSQSYKRGLKEGIKMYAWYDNGVLCVGPFGKTLERALAEIDSESGAKKPGISMRA